MAEKTEEDTQKLGTMPAPAKPRGATQSAQSSEEENQRVHDELSRVHPSARNFEVLNRAQVGYDLYVVKVGYTLATAQARQEAAYLVHDDGKLVTVFKAD